MIVEQRRNFSVAITLALSSGINAGFVCIAVLLVINPMYYNCYSLCSINYALGIALTYLLYYAIGLSYYLLHNSYIIIIIIVFKCGAD